MLENLNITNPEAAVKAFLKVACGEADFAQLSSLDFEIRQKETMPLEGYICPEDFPNCCEYHKKLYQIGSTIYSNFPNCCEDHKRLIREKWFNKATYSYVPDKLVKTVAYTNHCIEKYINAPSWYDLITEYIETTIEGYGQFPTGFGSSLGLSTYIENVKLGIKNQNKIPDPKKKILLSYLHNYEYDATSEKTDGKVNATSEKTDMNILYQTYQKWLKVFPFELNSYFGDLT